MIPESNILPRSARLDDALEHGQLEDGTVLYPPYVIVCHDTRYKPNSLTGLIRILRVASGSNYSLQLIKKKPAGC